MKYDSWCFDFWWWRLFWRTSAAGCSKKACLWTVADVPVHHQWHHHHCHRHHRHRHSLYSMWSMRWLMSLVTIAWWVGVTKHYASTTGESFYFSHCTVNNEEGDNDDDRFVFKNSNLLDFTFSAALNWTAKNSFAIVLHFSSVSFRLTTCKR